MKRTITIELNLPFLGLTIFGIICDNKYTSQQPV